MRKCCVTNRQTNEVRNEQVHSVVPVVTQLHNLLTQAEATYLIQTASQKFKKSTVVAKSGHGNVVNEQRSSTSAFLPKRADKVIQCIEDRIASVAGEPVDHLEPLQVTRYEEAQKYNPHHDYFPNVNTDGRQRTKTVFTYLNTVDEKCGGATAFPNLKDKNEKVLRVYPVCGNATMWMNLNYDGTPEKNTLHAGEAVTCSNVVKHGLNAWFGNKKWQ